MSEWEISERRFVPVRRLSADEADRLGYEGPLVLNRIERRFVLGPWRPTRWFAVTSATNGTLMTLEEPELDALLATA